MAAHYAVVERVTGRRVQDNAPALPREMRYLWHTFRSLSRARGSTGFGPAPISWADIDAYCRLMRLSLDAWEVEGIRALDDAYLETMLEGAANE